MILITVSYVTYESYAWLILFTFITGSKFTDVIDS